jgi:hypothetical protein
MKNRVLLISFLIIHGYALPQKDHSLPERWNTGPDYKTEVPSFSNDMALVKPMVSIHSPDVGYFSEFRYVDYDYMTCGAVVKNAGTGITTHIFIRMKALNANNTVLQIYYSDTVPALAPGQTDTISIGQLDFIPFTWSIKRLVFAVLCDGPDQNPVNDLDTVPFTIIYDILPEYCSRSIYPTSSCDIAQSGLFNSGDFIGIRVKESGLWMSTMSFYLKEPVFGSVSVTGEVFEDGSLLDTTQIILPSPPDTGWVSSEFYYINEFWEDKTYYAGIKVYFTPGASFTIGTDTAVHHDYAVESIANTGGNWTAPDFVPLVRLNTDPLGIDKHPRPFRAIVYPNPANGMLYIDNAKGSNIELYDLTGKMMLADGNLHQLRKIDVSGLTPGVYLLRIINKDSVSTKKIVIR